MYTQIFVLSPNSNYFKLKQMAINYITDKCSDAEVTEVESLIDGYARDVLSLLCGGKLHNSNQQMAYMLNILF